MMNDNTQNSGESILARPNLEEVSGHREEKDPRLCAKLRACIDNIESAQRFLRSICDGSRTS